jgi:hypothetical protein
MLNIRLQKSETRTTYGMTAPVVLGIFIISYKVGIMSFPVSLDASKSLGNRLNGDRMVGTGKVGQAKPTVTGPGEALHLDETKVLGARLNGASMVGGVKPVAPVSSSTVALTLDDDKTLGARIANQQMIGAAKVGSPDRG